MNLALTTPEIYVNQHWQMPSLAPFARFLGALTSVFSFGISHDYSDKLDGDYGLLNNNT